MDLKKRLGHSSTATAQRYMHAVEGRDAQIADSLSKLAESGDASKLPKSFSSGPIARQIARTGKAPL